MPARSRYQVRNRATAGEIRHFVLLQPGKHRIAQYVWLT
jgi:hypothetical protein